MKKLIWLLPVLFLSCANPLMEGIYNNTTSEYKPTIEQINTFKELYGNTINFDRIYFIDSLETNQQGVYLHNSDRIIVVHQVSDVYFTSVLIHELYHRYQMKYLGMPSINYSADTTAYENPAYIVMCYAFVRDRIIQDNIDIKTYNEDNFITVGSPSGESVPYSFQEYMKWLVRHTEFKY